jgi:transcriptional regulator
MRVERGGFKEKSKMKIKIRKRIRSKIRIKSRNGSDLSRRPES